MQSQPKTSQVAGAVYSTMLRTMVETRRKVLGEVHPDTLHSVNGLALLLQSTTRIVLGARGPDGQPLRIPEGCVPRARMEEMPKAAKIISTVTPVATPSSPVMVTTSSTAAVVPIRSMAARAMTGSTERV